MHVPWFERTNFWSGIDQLPAVGLDLDPPAVTLVTMPRRGR